MTTISADQFNIEQSKAHVFEGVVRYNLHKKDLERDRYYEECTESPEFELHHVIWKIKACKSNEILSDNKLVVTLVSVFRGKTEAWSCDAEASFKLLAKAPYNDVHTRFGYFHFDSVRSSPSKKKLIGWNDLLTKHMINDIATIDVTIKVKPPKRVAGIQHASTKFQMRIMNVNTLGRMYSEEAIVRGIRWKILAWNLGGFLGIYALANDDDMDLDYAWNVTATFDLMSLAPGKTVSWTFSTKQFDWTQTNYGFRKFIKWADFTNLSNKYVIDNTALLQIQLSVAKPKLNANS